MTARRIYGVIRAASLVLALGLFAFGASSELAVLKPGDALFLCGALALALALSFVRAPTAYFERSDRPTPNTDRIGLILPLLAVVFVLYGSYEAAAIDVIAHLVQPPAARRRSPFDLLLTASLRVPIFVAIAPLHAFLLRHAATFDAHAFLIFVGVNFAWCVLGSFFWTTPILALRAARSVWSYWRVHIRDIATFATIAVEFAWGYLAFQIVKAAGPLLGLGMLLTPLMLAIALGAIATLRAKVHRLTLSREAVEAMLEAHDPLPQMRLILESIDPRMGRESIEIFGFGRGGGDAWSSVVQLGPTPLPALTRSTARALYDLRAHSGSVEGVRAPEGVVLAYAAHDETRRLLGALVVYRAEGAASIVSAREFERAAAELAPLLSDYGTITATRTAASIDTLTGLVNRRAVGRAAEEALAYVKAGGAYAMLLLDIDHFKSVNDLLGHNAGDRALSRIGAILAENVREIDVAGRFGGEEFIVLMRDADRERALGVAERLRAAIETSGLTYADGKPLTISVGVSYARLTDGSSEALIERADRALYRAKNAGRNRVVESPLVAI